MRITCDYCKKEAPLPERFDCLYFCSKDCLRAFLDEQLRAGKWFMLAAFIVAVALLFAAEHWG